MSVVPLTPPPAGTGGLGLTKYLIDNTQALLNLAQLYIDSGFMPDNVAIHPKAQARTFAIITTGLEIGLAPMASVRGIYVTKKGRIAMMADLMLGIAMSAGATFKYLQNDEKAAKIEWARGGSGGVYQFTVEDARAAGLLNKDTYKEHLKSMLLSRCKAHAARLAAADRLSGIYTPDELGAEVRVLESGEYEIIEGGAPQAPHTDKATVAAGSAASPPSAPAAADGPFEAQAAVDQIWREGQPPAGKPAASAPVAPRRGSVKSSATTTPPAAAAAPAEATSPAAPATDVPGAPVMTGTYPYTSGPQLTPYEAGEYPEIAAVNDVAIFAKAVGLHTVAAYGADKVAAVKVPFDVAMDLKVSDSEPVVLRRCSKRQIDELSAWLKEVHQKALAGTEAK